jgi:3-deoxy-D-manno-octulosonic acid (KDO) 8-phosphate synthase
VIRNATTGAVDYVDVPAPARVAAPEARAAETPSDYLDIPAFLRRQAD